MNIIHEMYGFWKRNGMSAVFFYIIETYIGCMVNWMPGIEGFLLRRWLFGLLFKKCGKELYIYSGVRLSFTRFIRMGSRVAINSGCYIDGRGGLEIGDHVMIGPNCVISSCEHGFDLRDKPMFLQPIKYARIVIGNDVWIGGNVCIKSGVTIGDGSIVGAGSVVTKNVLPSSIVCGVPAKTIRTRSTI